MPAHQIHRLTARRSRPSVEHPFREHNPHTDRPGYTMRALLNLLMNLPWWIDLAILAVLAAVAYGLGWYLKYKFHRIVHEAVVDAGAALRDAAVTVHSV